jgi:general secretion pathway protein E
LVLATLHTNDAISAVTRLTDMGVERFLLASTLRGVLAQRLIRKLCTHCKSSYADGTASRNPDGCPACSHTGYSGRTGVHELFAVDDAARGMIHVGTDEQALRQAAQHSGMRSLHHDGMRWIAQGITTNEEMARVTRDA